eukprot:8856614-Pyramimonas_sp.AAC.1
MGKWPTPSRSHKCSRRSQGRWSPRWRMTSRWQTSWLGRRHADVKSPVEPKWLRREEADPGGGRD